MNIFKAWNAEALERLSRHGSLKAADRKFLADMARLAVRIPDPHAAMTHRQLNHLKDLLDAMPPEIAQQPAEIASGKQAAFEATPGALGILWPQSAHPRCKKWHGDIKGVAALLCATEGPETQRFPFEIFAIGKDGDPALQSALTASVNEKGETFYRGVFSGMRLLFIRRPRPGMADAIEVFQAK